MFVRRSLPVVASLAALACTSSSSSSSSSGGAPGAPPAQVDPAEASGVSTDAEDELLLESALLDAQASASTTLAGPGPGGQGDMDGGGPLDGGGYPDAGSGARSRIARPVYELLRSWGALVPSTCVTDSGWVDADGDGIPASTTLTFACSAQPGSGATLDATGAIVVTDTDDASAGSGYAIDFQQFEVKLTRPNGTSRTRSVTGKVTVTVKGTPPALADGVDIARDLTIAQTNVTAAGTNAWTHTATGTASYAPDAPADPFAAGVLTASGQGTNAVQIREQSWTRAWTRKTDPTLHWNRACRVADPTVPGFDSGAVVHTDDRGNVIRLAFTGCGAWTVTLNGAPL